MIHIAPKVYSVLMDGEEKIEIEKVAEGDVWAIRQVYKRLDKEGGWNYEPLPPSQEFLEKNLFTLAEAKAMCYKLYGEKKNG